MSLRRALGTFDATMVVVGGIIGAGIFINPAFVAQRLPTAGLVLAAWVAGGAIALAGAFVFAELAAALPEAGGEYAYLREAYHPLVGFLFGWASLLVIQGGGIAAVAITFANYALRLAGRPDASPTPLAIAAIALLAGINVLGVKPGSRVLNTLVVLKIAALATLIFGGLAFASARVPAPAAGVLPASGLLAFGSALVPILFSYGGWQSANLVAEETRDPRRTLPRALVAGTVIVILIYVSVNFVYLRALGREGLASTSAPAADAVRRFLGSGADRFVVAAIVISTFGFLDLSFLAQTRISFAMARDRLFPASLARLHPRFQTPAASIALQALWSSVLVAIGNYGGLVDSVVFADFTFFGLAAAAIFVLRRRAGGAPPAGRFRTPGYPIVPMLFVAAAALAVVSALRSSPQRSAFGALIVATGVPVYFLYARRRRSAGT
ncbi:MAG: amino acid permease [Acidobacteria bacterium]|nr:amino acid permease [Acidobacteriota bacterium]MCA1610008.1 amino acid permease [Acidobacteriota bacterium]